MPGPDSTSRKQRLLVYGTLSAVVVTVLAATWYLRRPIEKRGDVAWLGTDFAALPEVDLLRRYIRVDTSEDSGSELAGAEFLAKELAEMGLEPHIEDLGGGKANLWAILEGANPEALVLHNHIDVSTIRNADKWIFPPFGAMIDEYWLYGRGAFDMKSVTAAQLLALKALTERSEPSNRSVIFLATGSEEVGSQLGTRWILEQHPELVDRFWTVLTEGGVLEPKSFEEIKYWGIENTQKRFVKGSFCAATHDELLELGHAIYDWNRSIYEPTLVPEVAEYLQGYARSRDNTHWQELLSEARRALDNPAEFKQLPRYLRALFQNEVYLMRIEEDPSGGYHQDFFVHLLPGSDAESVTKRLLPEWLVHGVTMSLGEPLGAMGGSSSKHPAFRGLLETVAERHPETKVGPMFLSFAGTDSRFFREAGIASYGFSPFVIFNTDTFRKDTYNERIGLPGYVNGVKLYRSAVERLVE